MKWFAHDTDMHRNRKIRKLFRVHGAVAYGFWCVLLEKLYAAEGDFQIPVDHLWLEDIADDMKMSDYRTPCRILDTMAEIGLIDRQLWEEHIIYSPAIAKRGDGYMVKRAQEAEKKRRYREKQRELLTTATEVLSTVDTMGTVGQKFIMSPADPDPDPDLDPEIDKNLLESYIPECPDIELCSADALRDRAPFSKKEPEPSEPAKQEAANTVTPLDGQAEKSSSQPKSRKRKNSAGGARKISTPKNHPEQFDVAWDSYRKFCIAVESTVALSQARKEAVREWDKLIEGGDALETILDGLNFYMEVKRVEHQRKGEAFGVSHFCRFLSHRKWEAAIAYREQKGATPAPAKDITANVHADLQDITVLLRQLGRSAVLPPEWQERTGKTFTRQLDGTESDAYVAYLKGEIERLAVANP